MSQQKSLFAKKNTELPISRRQIGEPDMSEEKTVNRLFLQDGNHGK